ncbi:MAG: hypothetical protein HN742_05660 [Lentisphaerae bacterium]|nr:hypothetical protein [Lentisphaerota bacterium]MBT4823528.1 hypothetical protein [Lentisphaerota bacterium]MBT5606914.1 hypothetical protein [Lentisphaerota bacterium]MBT7059798.1 hypothetical protein [Lentisphaerota bacterium]MBT7841336.1 hypothetical protein [Lentisphaerota bacterium]
MRFNRQPVIWLLLACLPCLHGREFQVRRIGEPKANLWGTDEFQMKVTPLGTVRHIRVGDQELVWQGIALYTFPYAPGGKKPVRTVQGEGYGSRGLSVEAPDVSDRDIDGTHVWELTHLVATKTVLGGRPLCRVKQTLRVTPTGEIGVLYDCEWLESIRWSSFMVLIIFDKPACSGKSYLAMEEEGTTHTGFLDSSSPGQGGHRIRNAVFDQLSIRPDVGPLHVVWPEPATCALQWSRGIELRIEPRGLPRYGPIPKGHRARLNYRFLLPVSQE